MFLMIAVKWRGQAQYRMTMTHPCFSVIKQRFPLIRSNHILAFITIRHGADVSAGLSSGDNITDAIIATARFTIRRNELTRSVSAAVGASSKTRCAHTQTYWFQTHPRCSNFHSFNTTPRSP